MKAKAMAKFDRKPSVRLSSGLIPSDRRCASSRSATSAAVSFGPATVLLLRTLARRSLHGVDTGTLGTLGRSGTRVRIGDGPLSPAPDLRARISPRFAGSTAVSACGDGSAKCVRDRPMDLDRLDVAVDHRARIVHPELGEQVRDLAPLRSQDLALRVEVPELALERPDGLLPRRVHELLVGLARLALIGDVGEAPCLDLAVERLGERGMLVQRVLEACREVDLCGLDGGEAVEQLVRQGRRSVLDGTRQPVLASDDTEFAKDLEVELHLRHTAVRKRDTAVRGAGLDTDLGDATGAGRTGFELAPVAVEVSPQLLDRGVLGADLADLATDTDRDPVGLERPDEGGQLRGPPVVLALLLVDVGLREVDERRRIDVDVAVARVDREAARP